MTSDYQSNRRHIIVAGSGVVGLAGAAVLAQKRYTISVLGVAPPTFVENAEYGRVYALNTLSQQILAGIGVWDGIRAKRIFSYHAMHVFDGAKSINFHATDLAVPELGFIVEDLLLRNVLVEYLAKQSNVELLFPEKLTNFEHQQNLVHAELSSGRTLTAGLIVGADGVHSAVRESAGLHYPTTDYQQSAFTATVQMQQSCRGACWQWFHPDSILALLPLQDKRASIVWSCDRVLADNLTQLTDTDFVGHLNRGLSDYFGEVSLVSKRNTFPLYGGIVNAYTAPGIVLVGDAAHSIHPLAGQGANMGFSDINCLQRVLAQGSLTHVNLRRYERTVKGRNLAMKLSLEGIKLLFGNSAEPVVAVRRQGLQFIDRCVPLKTWFMRRAVVG